MGATNLCTDAMPGQSSLWAAVLHDGGFGGLPPKRNPLVLGKVLGDRRTCVYTVADIRGTHLSLPDFGEVWRGFYGQT